MTKMTFPRTTEIPSQSGKFWANNKDRYLRQLLIKDIEDLTKRSILVYYATSSEAIYFNDSEDITEVIHGLSSTERENVDIIINTPGGNVDAVEKLIYVLRNSLKNYRVIVPNIAKSGGTVVALSSSEIVLGLNSELGPIDPQFNGVPCAVLAANHPDPIYRNMAILAVDRMKALAEQLLKTGMLEGVTEEQINKTIGKLSSSDTYMSHGAVIDYNEAKNLGLKVSWLEFESPLWKKLWLLYCLYDHDTLSKNIGRIFEGSKYSITRPKTLPA